MEMITAFLWTNTVIAIQKAIPVMMKVKMNLSCWSYRRWMCSKTKKYVLIPSCLLFAFFLPSLKVTRSYCYQEMERLAEAALQRDILSTALQLKLQLKNWKSLPPSISSLYTLDDHLDALLSLSLSATKQKRSASAPSSTGELVALSPEKKQKRQQSFSSLPS